MFETHDEIFESNATLYARQRANLETKFGSDMLTDEKLDSLAIVCNRLQSERVRYDVSNLEFRDILISYLKTGDELDMLNKDFKCLINDISEFYL